MVHQNLQNKVQILEKSKVPLQPHPLFSSPVHPTTHCYSGQRARIQWSLFTALCLCSLFPLLGICFSPFIYALIRSTYFLFAILDLFSTLHLLCVQGGWPVMDYINWLSCFLASDWFWITGGQKSQIGVFYSQLSLLWLKTGCTCLLLGPSFTALHRFQ